MLLPTVIIVNRSTTESGRKKAVASGTNNDWDERAIRQAIRVLGAQPSHVRDVQGTARALRVVGGMLDRRGLSTEMFHVPGTMPLLVAGTGPLLVVTYLDDSSPAVQSGEPAPPRITGHVAVGPGVVRKAGVLAGAGVLLDGSLADDITLVVETDRHAGSRALEAWLDHSGKRFSAACYEAVDLPVAAPALFRSAAGLLVLRLTANAAPTIEDVYAGVLPDLGHALAAVLSAIRTSDAEIRLPGFYDGVAPPTAEDVAALQAVSTDVASWLSSGNRQGGVGLQPSHLALGLYCVPSLFIRSVDVSDGHPYVPANAVATIEVRLMPGQSPATVVRSFNEFSNARLADATVETLVSRPPVYGRLQQRVQVSGFTNLLPLAPGDSPAGVLESRGIATIGYSLVDRRDSLDGVERVPLGAIVAGTSALKALISAISDAEQLA